MTRALLCALALVLAFGAFTRWVARLAHDHVWKRTVGWKG